MVHVSIQFADRLGVVARKWAPAEVWWKIKTTPKREKNPAKRGEKTIQGGGGFGTIPLGENPPRPPQTCGYSRARTVTHACAHRGRTVTHTCA